MKAPKPRVHVRPTWKRRPDGTHVLEAPDGRPVATVRQSIRQHHRYWWATLGRSVLPVPYRTLKAAKADVAERAAR